ncbi:RdgB/HAM1 family non-canonical purine NTP pyrophosphatase [Deminuibacter soli]|uniref:dITP/XTP pyrophosphatase n=2 Tax=Deminuibacter soli TaxID=2291815 RepID=A0A3E1NE34_9BACT|nr:RdgB/HAM1 family non-canonical purine NTP pyrophosphatase [Deminuibacter soli]
MQKTLVFATNNENKVTEIRNVIGSDFSIITLKEAGIDIDIPEPHDTLEANATEKSTTIYRMVHQDCFSEDTGLEVTALNGEPGVKSARYAGEGRDFSANVDKLLHKLEGESNRRARFRTVISLLWEGREYFFEGICPGVITRAPKGDGGFGYDPVFIPDGDTRTFGEMTVEEKKQFSHRAKAMQQLIAFLKKAV